jgi:hypothetical protein
MHGATTGIWIIVVVVVVAGLVVWLSAIGLAARRSERENPGERGSEGTMIDSAHGAWHEPLGARLHRHGRPRSWMLVSVAIAALYAGGIAVIIHLWALCWACAGMMVLAVAVAKAIGVDDSAAVDPDRAPGPSAAGGTRQARARLGCAPMTGVVASDVKARTARAMPSAPRAWIRSLSQRVDARGVVSHHRNDRPPRSASQTAHVTIKLIKADADMAHGMTVMPVDTSGTSWRAAASPHHGLGRPVAPDM